MEKLSIRIQTLFHFTMIKEVKKLAKKLGYAIFTKPHYLNIWGFRADSTKPNVFDDEFHVFTNIGSLKIPKWAYWVFKCTTDPGTFWLRNPMNKSGTAILAKGQYLKAYALGMHRGKYKALVQVGRMNVIRDYDRDAVLDFNSDRIVKGLYGINIHRASRQGTTKYVDRYSAGCQVFANARDFNFFIQLCEVHRQKHGNRFDYTLVDKREESRSKIKVIAITGALIGLVLGGTYIINSMSEPDEKE